MAVTPTYVPSSFVQQALAGYLAVDGATAVPASAANPLPVTVVSGGSTSQIVVTQYVATAAATGYSVGDIIEHVVELNLTATPATVVASIWVNATQGTVLASAPSSSNIALVAGAVTAQPKYVAPASWNGTSFDARAYGSVSIWCITPPSAAQTIQFSPDNVNWFPIATILGSPIGPLTIGTAAAGLFSVLGNCWVQLNGGTGGTYQIGASQ